MHHMHDVHELTFVLMQSLYLAVKDRPRIHINAVVLFDIFCKTNLVLIFDVHELLLTFLVIHIHAQLADVGEVCDPVVADLAGHPFCQQRIAVQQKTSLGDTVGLVVELLRHHLIEIFQLTFLKNFCVETGHAVDGKAAGDGKVSHAHLSVIEDRHFSDFLLISRIFCLDLHDKTTVDLFHDLVYTRKQTGEQLNRPFLQGFRHDGMVGVRAGLCGHIPGFFPGQAFLIHQDTHQLCHCHGRMGVV